LPQRTGAALHWAPFSAELSHRMSCGWRGGRGLFLLGGVLPIILLLLLAWLLPESLQRLSRHLQTPGVEERMATVLRAMRISPAQWSGRAVPVGHDRRNTIRLLISPQYRTRTLLLSMVFALNSFVLSCLAGWLPVLLHAGGIHANEALRAAATIWVGAMAGSLLIGYCIDRQHARSAIFTALILAALALTAFAFLPFNFLCVSGLLFLVGGTIGGIQFILPGLAALIYPSSLLATGVGWSGSAGKLGAVVGPVVGGMLLGIPLAHVTVLNLLALPVVLSGVGFYKLFAMGPDDPTAVVRVLA
jgi:MFS transporter, AAHS family, 4-hydroxybenzoate transporter